MELIVAATGPSLTPERAERCRGKTVIAVNDAWTLLPFATFLYGPDPEWWLSSDPVAFGGQRWTCTQSKGHISAKRREVIEKYRLNVVALDIADGFCLDGMKVHHGSNAGFQAINLAICFGATRIKLIGFDMRIVDGRRHFFGDHPHPLSNINHYESFIPSFEKAVSMLPDTIRIINCTPNSALRCFPMGVL